MGKEGEDDAGGLAGGFERGGIGGEDVDEPGEGVGGGDGGGDADAGALGVLEAADGLGGGGVL